jgi:tetratricopeptide (TPR) repeat protein
MKLVDLSETSLSEEIDLYCNVLAGADRSKQLRDFLFSRLAHGLPHRATVRVREVIEAAAALGLGLTPMPKITMQGLERELRDTLLLLSACPLPIPGEILANAVGATLETLRVQLTSSAVASSVLIEDEAWRMVPSPVPLPKADAALCEKGLRALLAFIGDHKYEIAGRKQVYNALAVAQICSLERPHEVARMFIVLDKAVKGLGDKHLVLKAAELAIAASRRALPRTREAAEGEAQAMICGESWALQRIGRLQEAMIAAEKSLKLGQDIAWDRNTAYCEKCIGRLCRIKAEETDDRAERVRLLQLSVSHLQTAIYLFGKSSEFGPTHPDVGDCYSLLGRTYLVAGNRKQAAENVRKATQLLSEPHSKDSLDLSILQGELFESSNREAAEACFEQVLSQESAGDSERSEIAARAYFRRALNRVAMGKKALAKTDFLKAKEIWDILDEFENSSRASWELFKLDGVVPQAASTLLSKESLPVRVAAVQIHQDRLSQYPAKNIARRADPSTEYWIQLIRDARSRAAVESRQW